MAVAFDAVGPSSAGATAAGATSVTFAHTCTGSNTLLIVGTAVGVNGTPATSATYAGVTMTSLGKVSTNNQASGFVEMWYLVAPATGTNNVIITSGAGADFSAGSISFTGVDQTTPVGTPVTSFGDGGVTAPAATVTGTTTGNMVVDVVANGSSITASTKTQRWLRNTNGNSGAGNGAGSTAAAGGSVTMGYTASADWWSMIAVEVRAASGGAATIDAPPPLRMAPGLFQAPGGRAAPWFGTDSEIAAQTYTTDAVLDATATVSADGFVDRPAGASLAATALIEAAGSVTALSGASLAATAGVTASGFIAGSSAASLSATSTITAASTLTLLSGASLAGSASITTVGFVERISSATVAGSATVTAAGSLTAVTGTSLTGSASITTAGFLTLASGATLAATATITSAGVVGGIATLAGVATVTAVGFVVRPSGAALAGTVTITAAGFLVLSSGAVLAGTATVSAAPLLERVVSAALAATATITAEGDIPAFWGPPTGFTVTPISNSRIDLSWNAVTGASGYDIERDGVVIATDVADTIYSDTGLNPSTTYTYRARSVRA